MPVPVFTDTTADGGQYRLWFNAKVLAKGAARLGAKGALALGRGALDFLDNYTLDIQGKRAERYAEFEEQNERDRRLNSPLAIMDTEAEEQQAIWASHIAANAIQGPQVYNIATPDETDTEDNQPAASSSGAASSSCSGPAKNKKKAETPAEQKARLKKEGEAYQRKRDAEDRRLARDLNYRSKRF
jgi:hypothetical protein